MITEQTKHIITKLIQNEINNLFEILDFQMDSEQQIATTSAIHKLPRKGIDDTINNINQIAFDNYNKKTEEEKNDEFKNNANIPQSNVTIVLTLTNIYEDTTVNLDAQSGQDNLDFDRGTRPAKASLGKESEKAIEDFNDNIDVTLNKVKRLSNANNLKPPMNKQN